MYRLTQRRHGCSAQSGSVSAFMGSLAAILAFAATTANAAPRLNPEHVLRKWAQVSQAIVAMSKSARQRLVHQYQQEYNGHQIALAAEFRGPVDVTELLKRYRFTEIKQVKDLLQLTAIPRDDVERLFVKQWTITIDNNTHLPMSITFRRTQQGDQLSAIALLTQHQRNEIVRLARGDNLPQSSIIRTAAVNSTTSRVVLADTSQPEGRKMPSLIGLPWQAVAEALQRDGYDVRLQFGPPAKSEAETRGIYQHMPRAGEILKPRATVVLTIRDAPLND